MRRLLLTLLSLVALLLMLPLLALQREPALPPAPPGSNAQLAVQARLLWAQVRPGAAPSGSLRHTALSERDLNSLLAQGSQAQGDRWRARVTLLPDQLRLQASARAPGRLQGFWLNAEVVWDLRARTDGALPPLVSSRIGHLPLPPALVRWAVERWLRAQGHGPRLDAALQLRPMLEGWQAGPGFLGLRWRWQPQSAERAVQALISPADALALMAQRQRLQQLLAPMAPWSGVPVETLLQPLAELAQARQAVGGDAGTELRALLVQLTLFTLGRDLGQWLPEARAQAALPPVRVLLAGRDDMAMHWLLSAVLAWQGDERATAALGLAKELADVRVGSGFSFNDLAADAAGLSLGRLAARSPQQLLNRMAAGLRQDDFFPRVDDLPEFLSPSEFARRYGRLGSPAYEAEMQRIRERVAALPLYRSVGSEGPARSPP
ncbi:MAG: hypothetical protein J0L58_08215 [Burkholderiales bacterium]|uniref:hypothetical protein n=1 Tax=Inhella sp. TaxID=1921806 RepID=UPI001AC1ACBD|nr:hypothetical protein [Burkholderiales bacterium]